VFPRSAYPRPKSKPAAPPLVAKKPPPLPQAEIEAEEQEETDLEVVDEPTPRLPPPPPARSQPPPSRKPPREAKSKEPTPTAPATPRVTWAERKVQLSRGVRRTFSPIRLVLVGIVGLFVLTGLWVWHQQAVRKAAVTYAQAIKTAQGALGEGDLIVAAEQYRTAAGALDLMGRTDREAREIRQLAFETEAARNLVHVGLFELISEIEQSRRAGIAEWIDMGNRKYAGQWLILEASQLEFPKPGSGDQTATLTLPHSAGLITFRIPTAPLMTAQGTLPAQPILLAGKIASLATSSGTGGAESTSWEIVFDQNALGLWTSEEVLSRVGWQLDAETTALLRRQRGALGLSRPEDTASPGADSDQSAAVTEPMTTREVGQ